MLKSYLRALNDIRFRNAFGGMEEMKGSQSQFEDQKQMFLKLFPFGRRDVCDIACHHVDRAEVSAFPFPGDLGAIASSGMQVVV
jgi:hypothetical protein